MAPLALLCGCLTTAGAAPEADPTAQLRDQLRSVMLQLRTAQTEAANAQVAKAAAEQEAATLGESLKQAEQSRERLAKEHADEAAAARQSISELRDELAGKEKRLTEYQQALEQWKAGYQKAVDALKATESERASLADRAVRDERTIADLTRKNIALFNVSNEILDRFEGYSLGRALGAREPFIGSARVKVENLVQGYKDRILDQRLRAENP